MLGKEVVSLIEKLEEENLSADKILDIIKHVEHDAAENDGEDHNHHHHHGEDHEECGHDHHHENRDTSGCEHPRHHGHADEEESGHDHHHDHDHEDHEECGHDHHHENRDTSGCEHPRHHGHADEEECGHDHHHDHDHEDHEECCHDHHHHDHEDHDECCHDHHHDHEGHEHHHHDHGHQYDVPGFRIFETHSHEGATICSFEKDVNRDVVSVRAQMEECINTLEKWLDETDAAIGHVKGYIKESGPVTTFSTVGFGLNVENHEGGGLTIGFASIVFGPSEEVLRKKVAEVFAGLGK